MSKIYTFENEWGEQKIITGIISWGYEIEWYGPKIHNSFSVMPLNSWCNVKSYNYEMMGKWRLVKVV